MWKMICNLKYESLKYKNNERFVRALICQNKTDYSSFHFDMLTNIWKTIWSNPIPKFFFLYERVDL